MPRTGPLVCLIVIAGCDDATHAPREGDPCRPAAANAEPDGCADDSLWCDGGGICRRRPGVGEVCDPAPCGDGLQCHIDKRCGESRLEGEACSSSVECLPGLRCNHGELPELFAVGLCREPAGEGAPCGFEHAKDDLLGRELPAMYDGIDRGDCRAGLSCAPVYPAPGSGEAPPICADSKGVACFFAGECRPDGTLPLGAPCGRSAACQTGICAVFAAPLSATQLPGFGKGGEWLGPHVGTCVAKGDAIAACDRNDHCPKDFTCLDRECIAPHSQRPGEICSDPDGVECAFGLFCDGRECRYE